jgi:nitrate reductase (NAD(P)H)
MPPHVDAELAKSEGWWFKPEYICNDLSINSAIAKPEHDEILTVVPKGAYKCEV